MIWETSGQTESYEQNIFSSAPFSLFIDYLKKYQLPKPWNFFIYIYFSNKDSMRCVFGMYYEYSY